MKSISPAIPAVFSGLYEAAFQLAPDEFSEHLSRRALNCTNQDCIAANQLIALVLLEKMATATSHKTLEFMAANKATPEKMLRHLSSHNSCDVRQAVAENSATPLAVLLDMAHQPDADLRFSMAENPNLPDQVLELLCEDDNPYVSCKARESLEIKTCGKKSQNDGPARLRLVAGSEAPSRLRRFIKTLTRIAAIC